MKRMFAISLRSPYVPNASRTPKLFLTTIKELDIYTHGRLLRGGRVKENEVFQIKNFGIVTEDGYIPLDKKINMERR